MASAAPFPTMSAPAAANQGQDIDSYPVVFTGAGSEYFRIWIVNLLLIIVTLGIYTPWAKVRKLRYFYGNTFIDGHAMDFHGDPKKMLRGTLLVGAFFLLYSYASDLSPIATMVSLICFLIVWPPLYRASLRFRLANTSWRGMRMHMKPASLKEAYLCLTPPSLLLFAPLMYWAFIDNEEVMDSAAETAMTIGADVWLVPLISFGLFALTLPYFMWRINRFRIEHAAWGSERMQFRSDPKDMYKIFLGPFLLAAALVGIVAAVVLWSEQQGDGSESTALFVFMIVAMPLLLLSFFLGQMLLKAYLAAKIQNLLWSRTGNQNVRFKSQLSVKRYLLLQFKNHVLISLTLGLYWPFAVVANRRMQLEAVTLRSRIPLDRVADQARKGENDAAGDMAADFFDADLAM